MVAVMTTRLHNPCMAGCQVHDCQALMASAQDLIGESTRISWGRECRLCTVIHAAKESMERFTISLDDELAAEFDGLIAQRGYVNRSEAVRDLIRRALETDSERGQASRHCVANLSYVYNHHQRTLAERLLAQQHDHHDLCIATTHCHLDHENCLESVILKGLTEEVRRFSDAMIAESGVRHGQLNLVQLTADQPHAHGHQGKQHVHWRPAR